MTLNKVQYNQPNTPKCIIFETSSSDASTALKKYSALFQTCKYVAELILQILH